MLKYRHTLERVAAALAASLALLGLTGCGDGLKTHAVQGRVVLVDGDVKQLADAHVELVQEADSSVRADGRVRPDGSFAVQTLYQGHVLQGALAGTYKARISLPEPEDGNAAKRRSRPIHARFLDPRTSGLLLTVPTKGEVLVTVSRR